MNNPVQIDWIEDRVDGTVGVADDLHRSRVALSAFVGDEWRLSAEKVIRWRLMPSVGSDVLASLRLFIAHLTLDRSPATVSSSFRGLCTFFRAVVDAQVNTESMQSFGTSLFSKMRAAMSLRLGLASVSQALYAFKSWYVWCSDADIEGFDFDTSVALDVLVVGGGPKGEAVLSHDPKLGPLHPTEFDRLFLALREATATGSIPDRDLAAAWLFVAFGSNPKNLYLLNDEDLLKTMMADGTVKYELRIPRIKKWGVAERAQFRTRPLRSEIGELLERIVGGNIGARALIQAAMPDKNFSSAMFRLTQPRPTLTGTEFEAQSYRWRTGNFNQALVRVVRSLNLLGRDGEPLNLTPRRLRYTFATRLVQDGASPVILADALDHTDLQSVMVYYNARSDIVVKLDRAMAMKLAPWGQAFMGTIVRDETKAIRGKDPASRVKFFDSKENNLKNVGSCGTFGFCGFAAPVACYTCSKFQPWLDAPHEMILDALLADRDAHLLRGADPKMTQARDLTISAVANVIDRCRHMNASDLDG